MKATVDPSPDAELRRLETDEDESEKGHSVTVLVADARQSTRSDLRQALEDNGFIVVAEASDADEAVDAALEHRPQVCLLDMSMPGGGLAAAQRIFPELPDTKIAVLTAATLDVDLLNAIYAGADGYLLKGTAPDRMKLALHALLRGEAVLPRSPTGRLEDEPRTSAADNLTAMPQRSTLRYVPRLVYHYRRRRHSGVAMRESWSSARARMREYR